MTKRKVITNPTVKVGDMIYSKFDIKADNGSKKSLWFKGHVVAIISQDDSNVVADVDFRPDDTGIERVYLDKSKFGITGVGVWSFEEPVSYKRQKRSGLGGELVVDQTTRDIDYDEIIEQVSVRMGQRVQELLEGSEMFEKLLETRVRQICQEMIDTVGGSGESGDFILGDMTVKAVQRFNALQNWEKERYLGKAMTGVVNTLVKGGKTMCANYKNLVYVCGSKLLNSTEVICPTYASQPACEVHVSRFGLLDVRKRAAKDVKDLLLPMSMCCKCVSVHGQKDMFMSFGKKRECCGVCKVHRFQTNHNSEDDKIPVCTECEKAGKGEGFFKRALDLLPKVFRGHKLSVQHSVPVNIEDNGRNRYIDFTVTGTFKSTRFLIIIEMDQNQHRDYNQKDERKKMAEQVSFMMKSGNYDKIMIVRFNQNKEWVENKETVNYFKTRARAVILRSWLVWYLINIESVRTTMILYLWYDDDRRREYFEQSYPGFGLTACAPKNVESDWMHCAEPSEALLEEYAPINNRRVEVESVFKFWRKEHEQADDAVPASIAALMHSAKK